MKILMRTKVKREEEKKENVTKEYLFSLLIQEDTRWTGTHLQSRKTEGWNGETARALSQDKVD